MTTIPQHIFQLLEEQSKKQKYWKGSYTKTITLSDILSAIKNKKIAHQTSRSPRNTKNIAKNQLSKKRTYLQVALNSTPHEAFRIISNLPVSNRILLEAGTPLLKEYGIGIIANIYKHWQLRLNQYAETEAKPYIVADLKCMDRAEREVAMAASAGATAAVVLGSAPLETILAFIKSCHEYNLDSYLDMMGIKEPYTVLRQLHDLPTVVLLHRGVDEERESNTQLPIHQINKVLSTSDVLVGIAGGDEKREIQSSVFNGAHIVVLWKDFYHSSTDVNEIANHFLETIKD